MKALVNSLILLVIVTTNLRSQSKDSKLIRTYGIKINVTDMDKAIDFYTGKIGFEVESKKNYPNMVVLKSNDKNKLILNLVRNLVPEGPNDVKTGLTLQVNDYDQATKLLKSKGVNFGDNLKRKEGVGYSIYFNDPFGTQLSTMQVTIYKEEPFIEPRIYNYGILIPDMEKARTFFKTLGFVERSERYLPLDMPLGNADNSFGFMLHYRDGIESLHYNTANDEHIVILFQTIDIEASIKEMKELNIKFVQSKVQQNELGKYISFRDPFGLVYELVEIK
jgi:catechol 2,3-dioxygenase-like lactoylglutathione lyase family enzyme